MVDINTINDIMPYINDHSEFSIKEHEFGSIVDYKFVTSKSFKGEGSEYRRECRGLVFDKEGNLLSRRFHKFFNLGENEETSIDSIREKMNTMSYVIVEKEDGSMVSPILHNDKLVWLTMNGMTDVAQMVYDYVSVDVHKFCMSMITNNYTPIFEFCSLENKVVVTHTKPKLTLLAIRCNDTGVYINYDTMCDMAKDIDVVKLVEFDSLDSLIEHTNTLKDAEGYIIRFHDDTMVKLKGKWYLDLHNMIDFMQSKNRVLDAILNEKLDDILPHMDEFSAFKLKKYNNEMLIHIELVETLMSNYIESAKEKSKGNRKEFASIVLENGYSKYAFAYLDKGREVLRGMICESILKGDISFPFERDFM